MSQQPDAAIKEIDVLWITAGLGCDGDTIAMTGATQPSIEEIVLGALPGIPRVNFHNPFLSYENGDEFLAYFHRAAEGILEPFILVIEGSIPNENNKEEDYWAAMGTDKQSSQPIKTVDWIDRLAPKAWAVIAAGTCATYGGIHAMQGNPTGCMGLADYLGWKWKSKADIPIVCVHGCPVQPDNFMETLLYLLYQVAGRAPMIPLDDALRPTWLFGQTVHEGCDRGGYYEQAQFGRRTQAQPAITGGMGIGLALVRQLVQIHDGRVEAHSAGKVVAPALRYSSLHSEGHSNEVTAKLAGQQLTDLSVLVVDDSLDTIEMLRKLLELEGAIPETATNGTEALEVLRQKSFDLIISDISMPEMDGFELLRRIRTDLSMTKLPAVALTGFGRAEDADRAEAEGFAAHLTKPIDLDTLIETIRNVLMKRV